MTDLEHRLQEAARDESAAYQPSADLPERIGRRVRARRRRAQALAASGALVAVAVLGVVLAQLPGDDEQGVVANDPSTTTTTVPTTTTTTASTTSTTTSTTTTPPPPVFDGSTPLNAKGVGPVEAGMTVAQAEAASGRSFTLVGSTEDFGGCYYVDLEGQPDLAIRVSGPAGLSDAAFREGTIQALTIYDLEPDGVSTRRTTAGIGLGSSEADVRQAHAGAVEERPHDYVPEGAYLYVHPEVTPGFGIRYVLDERRVVTSIDVGLADSITAPEGCV